MVSYFFFFLVFRVFSFLLADILEDTNSQIASSIKQSDVHFQGQQNAALLGGMLVRHADDVAAKNGGKQWSALLLNVGNNKAFYWDIERQGMWTRRDYWAGFYFVSLFCVCVVFQDILVLVVLVLVMWFR
jgi:hypothetical protein